MREITPASLEAVLKRIRDHVSTRNFRITRHAQERMMEEGVTLSEVEEAVASAELLENYPHHRRGACCLLAGLTSARRPIHIVCTTAQPRSIIITVYEPKPPKWPTPAQRSH
jgi:hypothetical protein